MIRKAVLAVVVLLAAAGCEHRDRTETTDYAKLSKGVNLYYNAEADLCYITVSRSFGGGGEEVSRSACENMGLIP